MRWHRCIASQGEYFEGDHGGIQQWGIFTSMSSRRLLSGNVYAHMIPILRHRSLPFSPRVFSILDGFWVALTFSLPPCLFSVLLWKRQKIRSNEKGSVFFKFRVQKWKYCAPSNSIKIVHNSYCASNTALLPRLEEKRCNQCVICKFYTVSWLHKFGYQCVQDKM